MQKNSVATAALSVILGLSLSYSANAALVVADFNDNTPGQLAGQGGGTNLSGTWAASTNPAVVAGDLVAPLSTHYATPQSAGTPQSVQNQNTAATNANGQSTRTVATPLQGTIWFSFLVNPIDANARAGISFNTSSAAAGGARMDAVGTGFFIAYPLTPGVTLTNVFTTGTNHLVVGEVIMNEGGGANTNDHLRLWVDPDVNTLTESTTTNRVFDAATADWLPSGITSIAVQSYGNGSSLGGIVDAVRVSDGPNAAGDVGVPEPTGLALLGLGCVALFTRRRK
jgi:hypothetical protein